MSLSDEDLDTLAADADAARVSGEALIADYATAAESMVTLLSSLKSYDDQIAAANTTLIANGRSVIKSPNYIRHDMGNPAQSFPVRFQSALYLSVNLPSVDGAVVPFWKGVTLD